MKWLFWFVIVAIISFSSACVVCADDIEKEIKIGKYFDQAFCKEQKMVENKTELDRIIRIGSALVAVSERPKMPYTYRIYKEDYPSAFSAPGGFVYLSSGMYAECKNDSELAAVLAHEIAHDALSHGLKESKKAAKIALCGEIFKLLTRSSWGSMLGHLKTLRSIRVAETEADKYALEYLTKAGFNPIGAVGIFSRLLELEVKSDIHPAFATHPELAKRYKKIYEQCLEPRFEAAKKSHGLPIIGVKIYLSATGVSSTLFQNKIEENLGPIVSFCEGEPKKPNSLDYGGILTFQIKLFADERLDRATNFSALIFQADPFADDLVVRSSHMACNLEQLADDISRQVKEDILAPQVGIVVRAWSRTAKSYWFKVEWMSGGDPFQYAYNVIRGGKVVGRGVIESDKQIVLEWGEIAPGDILIAGFKRSPLPREAAKASFFKSGSDFKYLLQYK